MSTVVPTSSLPDEGALGTADVGGTTVALARVDGTVYAFADECTHAQCSLSEGDLDGTHVVCPCHLGTFDVTSGAVVSGPPTDAVRTWQVRPTADGVELV